MRKRILLYIIFLLQIICFQIQGQTVYENSNYKIFGSQGAIASISVKVDYNPEQNNYILTIGNPGRIVGFDGEEKALWLFRKETLAMDLCKKNSNLSCKRLLSLLPFSNNPKVEFSFNKEKRITARESLPFKLTAQEQEKINLKLRIYVSTLLKTETIEEEVFIDIPFLPYKEKTDAQKDEGSGGGAAGGSGGEGAAASPEEKKMTPEEMELARKDSIKQLVTKWEIYFTNKNGQIKQLILSFDQIDTATITKEEIEGYMDKVKELRSTADAQFQKRELLEENDLLTEKFIQFNSSCESALKKMEKQIAELQKEPPKEKEINWMLFLGIGLAVLMVVPSILTQVINSRKTKKMQKKQEEEQRRQAEEAERARLLADEDNVI